MIHYKLPCQSILTDGQQCLLGWRCVWSERWFILVSISCSNSISLAKRSLFIQVLCWYTFFSLLFANLHSQSCLKLWWVDCRADFPYDPSTFHNTLVLWRRNTKNRMHIINLQKKWKQFYFILFFFLFGFSYGIGTQYFIKCLCIILLCCRVLCFYFAIVRNKKCKTKILPEMTLDAGCRLLV